jgi:hypothetical protein
VRIRAEITRAGGYVTDPAVMVSDRENVTRS